MHNKQQPATEGNFESFCNLHRRSCMPKCELARVVYKVVVCHVNSYYAGSHTIIGSAMSYKCHMTPHMEAVLVVSFKKTLEMHS